MFVTEQTKNSDQVSELRSPTSDGSGEKSEDIPEAAHHCGGGARASADHGVVVYRGTWLDLDELLVPHQVQCLSSFDLLGHIRHIVQIFSHLTSPDLRTLVRRCELSL